MNQPLALKIAAAFVPLTALTSCGMFGSDDVGLTQVDELVSWIERVHVESELSRERVETSVASLRAMIRPEGETEDVVLAFADFKLAIEEAEAQAERLRDAIEPMKESAEPVFEQWETDLEAFTNEKMRERSRARLENTRMKYEAIVAVADPAQASYDQLVLTLKDHALFLEHDFNADSIAAIQEDVTTLAEQANELDGQLYECLNATRLYIESSALPMSEAAAGLATPR